MLKVAINGAIYTRSLKTKERRLALTRAKPVESKIFLEHYRVEKKPANHSQQDLFSKFITAKETRMLSKSTLSIYRKCWKNFTANRLNDLTPAYQRLHYRHLCAIFNWGIKEGLVKENPFRSLPKAPVPHVSYYTPKEVKAILAGLPDTRLGDAIHLFFLTGMRLGELVDLKPENVLADKIILTGKTGRRTIPITDPIREIIARGRVFNYNYNALSGALRKHSISATKIRHTFATTLVKKGISIYIVSKLMGHKSVKTTETYYAHLAPEEIKNHTDWLGW